MGTGRYTPRSYDDIAPDQRPSLKQAFVPVLGLVAFLDLGSAWLGSNPHIPFAWNIVLVGFLGRLVWGYTWEDPYEGIERSLAMELQAILILFIIYDVASTWVVAGMIPMLVYYGLDLPSPQVSLSAMALLVGIVIFIIGSSWTVVGTLGVAFISIGSGLGVLEPMTAGAILTGVYAGDEQSSLSDMMNLVAIVMNTDLYGHIRAMRSGTAVAFGLSLVGFVILSFDIIGTIPADQIAGIQTALASSYDTTLLALLPLAVTSDLTAVGRPALTVLLTDAFAGAFTNILVQGASFVTAWQTFMSGTGSEIGSELANSLLVSGDVSGSAWIIAVVVAVLTLSGLSEQTGVLAVFAHRLQRGIRNPRLLIVSTDASVMLTNALTAQQYMSTVVPDMMLRDTYDELDLDSSDLSQAIESAGTPTGVLLPWHAGGAYMAGILGVLALQYTLHYMFGCLFPLALFAFTSAGVGFSGNGMAQPGRAIPAADDD